MESEGIGVFLLKDPEDGALIAMFIQKEEVGLLRRVVVRLGTGKNLVARWNLLFQVKHFL